VLASCVLTSTVALTALKIGLVKLRTISPNSSRSTPTMVEANRPVSTTTPARLAFPTLMVHRSWITMRAATNSPPNRPAFSERLPIRCTPCKRKNRYLTTRKANSSERRTALSALMSVFIQVYYILLSNNDTVPVVPGEVAHPTGYSTQTSTIQLAPQHIPMSGKHRRHGPDRQVTHPSSFEVPTKQQHTRQTAKVQLD